MRLVYLLVCALALTAAADTPEETSGARNLALLEQYGELGRRGDYAAQARLWAPDAVNNGRPMSIDEIRAQLEDIHRVFPDHASIAIETTASGDLVIVLTRTSGTFRGVAQTSIYGGMLRGARPTGKRFEVLRAHWWRLMDDGASPAFSVVALAPGKRQLGLIPDTLPVDKLVSSKKD